MRSTLVLCVLTGLVLSGCGGGGGSSGSGSSASSAKTACEALGGKRVAATSIGLPTTGAMVTGTVLVPASSTSNEFCKVTGQIASVDPAAQPILFEADMPSAWNGKLLQLGGGGWDGSVASAMTSAGLLAPPLPVDRGYVTFGSDGGHESTDGDASFATNAEQLQNFGGDQVKKTHDAVWALVNLRYGALPQKTYFLGASNGGREAFAAFQRWPADYDGVIALYPAFDWTPLFVKLQQIAIALRGSGGIGWFDAAKATALKAATVAACDGLDGVTDGIVSNVAACHFDPVTLRCPGGTDSGDACLSDAQLRTLGVMTSAANFPYTLANGVKAFPGFGPTADWAAVVGTSASFVLPTTIDQLGAVSWYADGLVRYLLLPDPNANPLAFDPLNPGPQLARLQQVSAMLDQTNSQIKPFLDRGGKLIVLHGTDDSLVAPQATVDYYQALVGSFGQAPIDTAVRAYLVPGFGHGGGAFNPIGALPLLDALDAWVVNGVAPTSLVMTDTNPGTVGRTRPLCVYPTWAKYSGRGDPNVAANYSCVAG